MIAVVQYPFGGNPNLSTLPGHISCSRYKICKIMLLIFDNDRGIVFCELLLLHLSVCLYEYVSMYVP